MEAVGIVGGIEAGEAGTTGQVSKQERIQHGQPHR